MRNIKVILSYDGTDFHGWQTQPGLRTVQEVLEEAVERLTGEFPAVAIHSREVTTGGKSVPVGELRKS